MGSISSKSLAQSATTLSLNFVTVPMPGTQPRSALSWSPVPTNTTATWNLDAAPHAQ